MMNVQNHAVSRYTRERTFTLLFKKNCANKSRVLCSTLQNVSTQSSRKPRLPRQRLNTRTGNAREFTDDCFSFARSQNSRPIIQRLRCILAIFIPMRTLIMILSSLLVVQFFIQTNVVTVW